MYLSQRRCWWVWIFVAGWTALACTSPTAGPTEWTGTEAPDEEGEPAPADGITRVRGIVWAPGNSPSTASQIGQEIPVQGAIVRLLAERPAERPAGAHCSPCQTITEPHTFSNSRGVFEISGIGPGDYYLVIEKGLFRAVRQISVPAAGLEVGELDSTLPSKSDPTTGDLVPRIALASGASDPIESILGKAGFGEVAASGDFIYTLDSTTFDIYSNGGALDSNAGETLADLVMNFDKLLGYDMVIIPCSGSQNTAILQDEQALRNLRDYVAMGGRLYVTDWSGEWVDNVFPAQVTLDESADTPESAYDIETDTWNTEEFGDANGSSYDANQSQAVDGQLREWLDGQSGPTGTIDAGNFSAVDNWNRIDGLSSVEVGVNEDGETVIDKPHVYVRGEVPGHGERPLTVTYEPAGCGRVMFSTYHTAPHSHPGLLAQERVLLYLLMEIGVCVENPIVVVD